MNADRQKVYVNQVREASSAIWNAIAKLESLQAEWNALDYATTMEDGEGVNEGIAKADVGSVVFDTAAALRAVLNQGHGTNLAKML